MKPLKIPNAARSTLKCSQEESNEPSEQAEADEAEADEAEADASSDWVQY